MKRWITCIFTAALVLSIAATGILAAGPGRGRRFVDNDGDGICDYAGTNCQFTDTDGDGICDVCGNGGRYVDADNDGVCDLRPTGARPRNGSGCEAGYCGGRGR